MEFNSFSWISEAISFSLQAYCFYLFRGRKSLQLLMLVLCLRNLASVATHSMPWSYFYQIYFGRIITALIGLWALADVACHPGTPKWTLRLPVAFAALLAIPYWPTLHQNGPGELEQYRVFCLCLALFILALHTIFLVVARQSIMLQLLLLAAFAVEVTGALGMLKLGYQPQVQMFCWWVSLAVLGSFPAGMRLPIHPALSGSPDQTFGCAASTEATIRLPLQSRLPHSRIYERLGS